MLFLDQIYLFFCRMFLFADLGCTPLPPFAENIFDRNNFANISLNPQNSIWKAPLYNLTFTLILILFTCFRVRWHDLVNDNRISSLLLYLFEDCRLVHYFPCNNGPSTENLLKYTIVHPHISCINPNDLVGTLRRNTFGNLPFQRGPR